MATQVKRERNQSMEAAKLIASVFVVFIHVSIPGEAGSIINCLARFAVPMFFALSGYFNYGADSNQVWKRTVHIVKVYLIAVTARIVWGCFETEYDYGSTVVFLMSLLPQWEGIMRWIILQIDPFAGHLWYLNAMIWVYVLYWMYVRFFGEKKVVYAPLYFAGFSLFAVFFTIGILMMILDGTVSYFLCRNAWLTGLPMFIMGVFLHEYQDEILDHFGLNGRRLMGIIAVCIMLTLLQHHTIGGGDMLFGTVPEVIALILLMVSHPKLAEKSKLAKEVIARCGAWSMWIYILHLLADSAYLLLCQPWISARWIEMEEWIHPFVVLGIAFAAAVVCERITYYGKQIRWRHA